ncbi:hypothetical protein Smp_085790.1 [Schistosoma mansoni]|uniref:hypothetical protein n=1 Tax=Schistosoma mansoni TaxID=6183 RepID=UPI0001A62128|nr:hypothetical protein Smp_085790.1 [Schistosoma mansoni]|eukprot:XP_018651144.1 hypothetical protein Smp_085790.1 [Schistosoma mansoni]
MVEDNQGFGGSVGRQYFGDSVVDSSFYSDNIKTNVFNFMGELKPNIHGISNPVKPPHTSEKRRRMSPVLDNVIPHKYYLCETAMANHFAQMNLTLPVDASKIQSDCNSPPFSDSSCFPLNSSQIASAHHLYQNLSLYTNKEAGVITINDDEDIDEDEQTERLSSEPSLAIVPFNPDPLKGLIPPNFSDQETSKENSDSNVSAESQVLDSSTVLPTFDNVLCMDIDSDFTG